jgi:hypothetical protein
MNNIYWTMKNGQKINVDDMDITHLRNTLKMIIRNSQKRVVTPKFQLNGDIATMMVDDAYDEELYEEADEELYNLYI